MPESVITRAGVMERFWRGHPDVQAWVGHLVCVNTGDAVYEGRLEGLPPSVLVLELPPGFMHLNYDDVIAVERIDFIPVTDKGRRSVLVLS